MDKQTFYLLGDNVCSDCSPHIKSKISSRFNLKMKETSEEIDGKMTSKVINTGDTNLLLSYLMSLFAKKEWADYLVMGACQDDVRTYMTGTRQVSPEEYMDNLEEIAEISGMVAENRFWVLATPVSEELQTENQHYSRLNRDIEHYNQLAMGLLPMYDIGCIDLYNFTNKLDSVEYKSPNTFRDHVSKRQADFLVESIFF